MIISINPTLFNIPEESIQIQLSKIIDLFLEKKFIWDIDNVDALFINSSDEFSIENSVLYKTFLSKFQQDKLLTLKDEIVQLSAYQTEIHNKYLSKLNIGLNDDEIHPERAYKVLSLESKVIVENGINDWNFIYGIVEKYKNHKERKSIYKLIKKAIEQYWLISQNAGGIGMIWKILEDLMNNNYDSIQKYKIMALFDSDRDNFGVLSQEQKLLIRNLKKNDKIDKIEEASWCENDIIPWHMLYKRSLENYIPLGILEETQKIPLSLLDILKKKNNNELDFYKYDETEFRKNGINIKEDFPALFLSQWTKEKLEQICIHHKCKIELPNGSLEEVTEPEYILIKIARLI